MRVDYQPLTITAATASSEAPDYPAHNLLTARTDDAWRSAGGGAQTVTLFLAAPSEVAAVWLYGCNMDTATVTVSDVSGPLVLVKDAGTGLSKGRFQVGGASVTEIKITLEGTPPDGYWQIGAVHVFGAEGHIGSIGERPQFPLQRQRIYPQISRTLPNGKVVVARTGTPFWRISGRYHHENGSGVGALIEAARTNGSVSFDMEIPSRPDLAWVVSFNADSYEASVIAPHTSGAGLDESTFVFDELT